jgi:hypothetical protein
MSAPRTKRWSKRRRRAPAVQQIESAERTSRGEMAKAVVDEPPWVPQGTSRDVLPREAPIPPDVSPRSRTVLFKEHILTIASRE